MKMYMDDALIFRDGRVVIMGEGIKPAQWIVESDNTVSNTNFSTAYKCSVEADAIKICKALNDHSGHLLNFTRK